ncbi:MAG: hypothetical protein HYT71_00710 [Candidatus Aenigmarchaeota archaeon]|nr:hypothetical protein [Candidatus Aenigmarchaeota archaeon]
MQNKPYLFAVEFSMNGGKPVKGKIAVEFIGGTIHYVGENNRNAERPVRSIGDEIVRIRYNSGLLAQRKFGLYGLTDGRQIIVDSSPSGSSMSIERDGIKPSEPLSVAHELILPDGRVYVEESLLMRGSSDKETLKRVKHYTPELFERMLAELSAA